MVAVEEGVGVSDGAAKAVQLASVTDPAATVEVPSGHGRQLVSPVAPLSELK